MNSMDYRMVRLHVVVLLGSWLAGTVFVLMASSMAPTIPPSPVTLDYLHLLQKSWVWYAAGYGLFFVTDASIALLGVSLCAWLRPDGNFRSFAIVALFMLSGLLGILADLQMLGAAQLFRSGSHLLTPESAPAFLDYLNTTCDWLSTASFFPPALGAWLLCVPAQVSHVSGGWIALTKFGSVFQAVIGLISVVAFLFAQPLLVNIALIGAVFGLPIFTAVWLVCAIFEMKKQTGITTKLS